ncbi:hypothetical protein IW261DRAFT_1511696 [Armillaria novae-zelandiae]|uniref:Uncharacterized protein n=1 Tax=Armillaria novae-zelandiae TaxID=153914 RepID=A0AA39NTB9_9AGAR|nr:hypothetical protein IW261DRAFT_1511696 [Armillaria novae-zelandiae]
MSASYKDCTTFVSTYPNIWAGTDAPNFSFASGYSNELAGLATPPPKRLNATLPQHDPDSLLFAFPFSQPEDTFVSPVSTLLPSPPSYNDSEDRESQEDTCDDDMAAAYAKVVQRKFLFPPASMLATPPATPQRQRNRFEPYNVRDRPPMQPSLSTAARSSPARLKSQSPICRSQARVDRSTSSPAVVLHPSRLSEISTLSSTSVSSSTTSNEDLKAEPCPRYCVQEDFPPEFVWQVAEKFGIPPAQILHYRKMDGNFHYCPLDCGNYTVGSSMVHHLKKHHPDIQGTTVSCTVRSLKGERCLRQPMEGATFLAHFERDHCIQEALCPFCLAVAARPKLMDHFEICSEIEHPAVEGCEPQPQEQEQKPRAGSTTRGGWIARTLRRKKLPFPRVQKAPSFVMKLRPKKRRPARYA